MGVQLLGVGHTVSARAYGGGAACRERKTTGRRVNDGRGVSTEAERRHSAAMASSQLDKEQESLKCMKMLLVLRAIIVDPHLTLYRRTLP